MPLFNINQQENCMNRRDFVLTASATSLAGVPLLGWAQSATPEGGAMQPARKPDVHFVPTPMAAVDKMLEMANLQKSDRLYDLGSGDGRIVIRAAEKYGVRGTGIDIDPQRIAEANTSAKKANVTQLANFKLGDVFEENFSDATVITVYLLPSLNRKLMPKLKQLKPGTRIVSHAFDMGDWKPQRTETVEGSTLYMWTV
jgi:SAM-dependent methyltransferase